MPRLLLALLALTAPQAAVAYSCPPFPTVEELFESSDAAAMVRVIKKQIDLAIGRSTYVVEVLSSKKGNLPEGPLLVRTRGKCRAPMRKGEEYVVFLEARNGKYWAYIHTGWLMTAAYEKYTRQYLDFSVTAQQ